MTKIDMTEFNKGIQEFKDDITKYQDLAEQDYKSEIASIPDKVKKIQEHASNLYDSSKDSHDMSGTEFKDFSDNYKSSAHRGKSVLAAKYVSHLHDNIDNPDNHLNKQIHTTADIHRSLNEIGDDRDSIHNGVFEFLSSDDGANFIKDMLNHKAKTKMRIRQNNPESVFYKNGVPHIHLSRSTSEHIDKLDKDLPLTSHSVMPMEMFGNYTTHYEIPLDNIWHSYLHEDGGMNKNHEFEMVASPPAIGKTHSVDKIHGYEIEKLKSIAEYHPHILKRLIQPFEHLSSELSSGDHFDFQRASDKMAKLKEISRVTEDVDQYFLDNLYDDNIDLLDRHPNYKDFKEYGDAPKTGEVPEGVKKYAKAALEFGHHLFDVYHQYGKHGFAKSPYLGKHYEGFEEGEHPFSKNIDDLKPTRFLSDKEKGRLLSHVYHHNQGNLQHIQSEYGDDISSAIKDMVPPKHSLLDHTGVINNIDSAPKHLLNASFKNLDTEDALFTIANIAEYNPEHLDKLNIDWGNLKDELGVLSSNTDPKGWGNIARHAVNGVSPQILAQNTLKHHNDKDKILKVFQGFFSGEITENHSELLNSLVPRLDDNTKQHILNNFNPKISMSDTFNLGVNVDNIQTLSFLSKLAGEAKGHVVPRAAEKLHDTFAQMQDNDLDKIHPSIKEWSELFKSSDLLYFKHLNINKPERFKSIELSKCNKNNIRKANLSDESLKHIFWNACKNKEFEFSCEVLDLMQDPKATLLEVEDIPLKKSLDVNINIALLSLSHDWDSFESKAIRQAIHEVSGGLPGFKVCEQTNEHIKNDLINIKNKTYQKILEMDNIQTIKGEKYLPLFLIEDEHIITSPSRFSDLPIDTDVAESYMVPIKSIVLWYGCLPLFDNKYPSLFVVSSTSIIKCEKNIVKPIRLSFDLIQ